MERRSFVGALLGLLSLGAVGSSPEELAKYAPLVPQRKPITGVGVLRYPPDCYDDGTFTPARETAAALASQIYQGSILALPNDRDERGRYLWDFRIEGGDPGQVTVKRQGE